MTSLEPGEFLRRRTASTSAVLGRARTTSTASGASTTTGSSSSPLHIKKFAPDQPIHVAQDSLFSSTSGWTNFRGFFNLAILLLFVSNGRVALENLIKYGILISPIDWIYFISTDPWNWPNLTMVILSNVGIIIVYLMEKILAKGWLSDKIAACFYVCLFTVHICAPVVVTLLLEGNPLYSTFALSIYVVLFLKLTSYVHVNYWCRNARALKRDSDLEIRTNIPIAYPSNLTLENLYYFILAPTLCYELRFPRSPGRRKTFMIKRTAELICLSFIIVALSQQWVVPLLRNSVEPFSTMNISRCIERILKLAIPNHVIWLICFYTIFHSFLNLVAELLRFADRQFYLDFWNAETISYFWQTWNIPVHRWALRHVYKPMVRNGFGKTSASVVVFFISAFFHEYLVSIPLHMFRLWAYYAMMAQIPLRYLTDKILKGGRPGNIVMWLSLILGQPMTILMYVHDWYIMHYPHGAPNGTLLSTGNN
uniref:O-acyltransferase n=1 Tax=Ascaris suum TaxID=6253 RepID=F1L472_ASCSU